MATEPRKGVLLIGWQARAVCALNDHGAAVTCVLEPADIPKSRLLGLSADVVVEDVASAECVAAGLARDGLEIEAFHRICGAREKTVLPAALVAGARANGALEPSSAVALRDKSRQKTLLRQAGVPVADHWVVEDIRRVKDFGGSLPAVVKPLNGVSTTNTQRIDEGCDWAELARTMLQTGPVGPWLVESWVSGAEIEVDGIVRDGNLLFFAVAPYLANLLSVRENEPVGSVALDPKDHGEQYASVRDITERSLKALGHGNGVFHLELFETSNGLVFSECAGRPGGGLIYASLERMFNIDIYDEWARSVLDVPSGIPANLVEPVASYGWVNLTAPQGRIVCVPDVQKVLEQPDVVVAEVDVAPGDLMGDVTRASNLRAGRIVVRASDAAAVGARLREVVNWFAEEAVIRPQEQE
ncbi:acetyl-CoA carboxylase biotin carboxylase subunit family protein [Streptomyces sp. NBC_01563]|uniref:ATP-grasp domain-containing protein n=1 Tax=Streptomyces sp. NBC_01563 TaxID=2975880 RepID=UPI0038682A9D